MHANEEASDLTSLIWRFGIAQKVILAALEGLEGVQDCKDYKYTEELTSWKYAVQKLKGSSKSVANEKVWYFLLLVLPVAV